MNIEQIAKECKAEFTPAYSESPSNKDTIVFTEKKLQAFAKAIIKAYVAEQKLVAWRLTHIDGSYEIVTRESWQKVKNVEPLYDLKGE